MIYWLVGGEGSSVSGVSDHLKLMQVSTGSKLLLSRSGCPGESEPSPMTLGKDLRRRDDAIFVQIVFVLTGYNTPGLGL